MNDPYREEEAALFRSFLAPLQELLLVCSQSIGQAIEATEVDQARLIVERVMSTLEELIRQTRTHTRPFLERLDPPEPPVPPQR